VDGTLISEAVPAAKRVAPELIDYVAGNTPPNATMPERISPAAVAIDVESRLKQ